MNADLLADLEDLGEENEVFDGITDNNVEEIEEKHVKIGSLFDITTVHRSHELFDTLNKIEQLNTTARSKHYNSGPVELHPEYETIVTSNGLSVELEFEIQLVSKRIKDIYANHFPELESLILNPLEFAKVVKLIGNETDMTKIDLKSILPSATVMVINVTATTTQARQLTNNELDELMEACEIIFEMERQKQIMLQYVESRMSLVAPNLTCLLGSSVAARIMAQAGGLTLLSKIPACNILVIGAQKRASVGLSRVSTNQHQGVIYDCELVRMCPKHVQRKSARLVSAKCALASRVDLSREYADGRIGMEFKADVEKKIALLLEPPPSKQVKALPMPIEFKKKRGGKRARREKERLAASDLQKAANRMAFGEAEQEIIGTTGESMGLGLIGGSTVPVSKKHKNMQQFSNETSGFVTSVAMTPNKGIELENPDRKEVMNDNYFQSYKKK